MKSKLLKMLVVLAALVPLAMQRPLAADCAFNFTPGTTLDSDVTVYPNWTVLPGELNSAHGFTTPSSWFAVNVSNPNSPIPVGVYPAWCVDESHFLPATFSTIPGEPYSGTVIATCDAAGLVDVPSRGGTPPVGPPPITSLETWKKLNYLLNHKAGYYWWDVQVAVHRLVGGPSPNDPNLADPDLRFPPASASAIDAMIADAEANAATWTVPCGGVVGVLYVIDDPLDISLYQLLVLEVPFISTPTVSCPNDIVLQQTKGTGGFYCGYTQGGWGATPSGNNPGMLLKNNFATAYPTGVEIGIPGTSGYSIKFTSAAAIEAFLPAGSTASALTADAVNPTSCSAGVFAGQVLACTLNVRFSAAGITPNVSGQFGNLVYTDVGSPLSGKTVNQILAIANTLLGGGSYPGVTIASMNSLMTSFNEGFDNCSATAWASAHLLPAAQPVDTTPASTGFATATDTCDAVVTYTDEITPGSCGGYEIKRTWTATNPLGNFSSCTQTIVVLGNTPPAVTVNSGAICTGDSFTLTASGASVSDTFLWSNGETTQSITVSPSSTTLTR